MSDRLTYGELTSLMKSCAGLTVDPKALENRPDATFAEYGLDSLGLLGIVAELENRRSTPIAGDAETAKTPGDFIALVNASLTTSSTGA
jgi:minimal PKS acyl carrier protein